MRGLGARDLRRAVARYRLLLAAGLAAASVAAGLSAVAPTPPSLSTVVTAARDLAPGAVLVAEDLSAVELPAELVPEGAEFAAAPLVGALVAAPVRRGEVLTDVRLLGAGLITDPAQVAVPVRVAEPAAAALLQAGDRIDVLAASPEGESSARVIASNLSVLSVPGSADDRAEGALVVVATGRETAARLAAAAVTSRLSLVLLPRPGAP